MNSFSYIITMFEQAGYQKLLLAGIIGAVVSFVYLSLLKFSINILEKNKNKIVLFAGLMLVRWVLFFGILLLIADKNIAIILIYVVTFVVVKKFILMFEKRNIENLPKGGKND